MNQVAMFDESEWIINDNNDDWALFCPLIFPKHSAHIIIAVDAQRSRTTSQPSSSSPVALHLLS
jgi:hypothetical protein